MTYRYRAENRCIPLCDRLQGNRCSNLPDFGSWEIPTANSISRERSINNGISKLCVQAFI